MVLLYPPILLAFEEDYGAMIRSISELSLLMRRSHKH